MLQGFPSQAHCFRNGLLTHVTAPIVDDGFPGHASGDLFEDIGHEDAGPDKGGLAVADRRVGDNVLSECLLDVFP
jgi:hypothetical protein